MPEDSKININAQGNAIVIANGDISNPGTIGEFSGDVANVVNDTPDLQQSNSAGTKALLNQLHNQIAKNDRLSPEHKALALEQVKALESIDQLNPQEVMFATTEEST